MPEPTVVAVSRSATYTMAKPNVDAIRLIDGLGVDGDVHAGTTVKHRSRMRRDPTQPNLRQVHLIHAELHDELRTLGFDLAPGRRGENVTTRGVDLLGLATGTRLQLGDEAVVEVTGLRNPCVQLDHIQAGLLDACVERDGAVVTRRKAGVMAVVVRSGEVRVGDPIAVVAPDGPHQALRPV